MPTLAEELVQSVVGFRDWPAPPTSVFAWVRQPVGDWQRDDAGAVE